MKINEAKLMEYVEDETMLEFDTEEDFLEYVNHERHFFYNHMHPNDFVSFEETKQFAAEYQLHYKGKYYLILFEEALDIYED